MANEEPAAEVGNIYIEPIVMAGKVLVLFFGVLIVIPKMLYNTLVHDTPHGKSELPGGEG